MSIRKVVKVSTGEIETIPQILISNGAESFAIDKSSSIPHGFSVVDNPIKELPKVQEYNDAMMSLFQFTAVQMGYDSWQTCALRAYRPGPFEAEGTAFYDWMESCNAQGYATLAAVTNGVRAQPTIDEFLGEMPPFVRP